jgi:hypothetical protein
LNPPIFKDIGSTPFRLVRVRQKIVLENAGKCNPFF